MIQNLIDKNKILGEDMNSSKKTHNKQKKRILLLSDIHGDVKSLKRTIKLLLTKKRVDYILIAGDIAGTICYPLFLWTIMKERQFSRPLYAKLVYGRAKKRFIKYQLKTVRSIFKWLGKTEIPTVMTYGNTDTSEVIEEMKYLADKASNIYFLRSGESITLSNLDIIAIGGATYQRSTRGFACPHDYTAQQYAQLVKKAEILISNNSTHAILLTHDAPFNSSTDLLSHSNQPSGNKLLHQLDLAMQPLLHVCGHFHESQSIGKIGRSTIINPGALMHKEYALCELNLSSKSNKVITKLSSIPRRQIDPVELIYRFHRFIDKTT